MCSFNSYLNSCVTPTLAVTSILSPYNSYHEVSMWNEDLSCFWSFICATQGCFLLKKHNGVHSGVSLTSALWTSLTHAELVKEHAKHMYFNKSVQIWRAVCLLRENTRVSWNKINVSADGMKTISKTQSKTSTTSLIPLHKHTFISMVV